MEGYIEFWELFFVGGFRIGFRDVRFIVRFLSVRSNVLGGEG